MSRIQIIMLAYRYCFSKNLHHRKRARELAMGKEHDKHTAEAEKWREKCVELDTMIYEIAAKDTSGVTNATKHRWADFLEGELNYQKRLVEQSERDPENKVRNGLLKNSALRETILKLKLHGNENKGFTL